jgi:hypothetical protein
MRISTAIALLTDLLERHGDCELAMQNPQTMQITGIETVKLLPTNMAIVVPIPA